MVALHDFVDEQGRDQIEAVVVDEILLLRDGAQQLVCKVVGEQAVGVLLRRLLVGAQQ